MHDNFRVRALRAFLETAKIAWRNNKFKTQFMLDDGSIGVLDFDGEDFKESEFGIDITTASSDTQMMQAMQSLAQPFMQNGGTLSMIAELYRTTDPISLQRKLETFEEDLQRRQSESEQANRTSAEQIQQGAIQAELEKEAAKSELEHRRLDVEESSNIRDNETRLIIAGLAGDNGDGDRQKLELQRQKLADDKDIKEKQLSETIRKNKKDAEIKIKSNNSRTTKK
jgi:hypothetical protein